MHIDDFWDRLRDFIEDHDRYYAALGEFLADHGNGVSDATPAEAEALSLSAEAERLHQRSSDEVK